MALLTTQTTETSQDPPHVELQDSREKIKAGSFDNQSLKITFEMSFAFWDKTPRFKKITAKTEFENI